VDSPGSGYVTLAGYCECGDEPSGSDGTELVSGELEFNYGQRQALICSAPCRNRLPATLKFYLGVTWLEDEVNRTFNCLGIVVK
jgi:hypothetical protein